MYNKRCENEIIRIDFPLEKQKITFFSGIENITHSLLL